MPSFSEAEQAALSFRQERDWEQFHNLKDIAISINLEASELLELFQWSGSDTEVPDKQEQMKEELADVIIYCIYMAKTLNANIPEIVLKKIQDNGQKYPVDKARGTSKKYTEL